MGNSEISIKLPRLEQLEKQLDKSGAVQDGQQILVGLEFDVLKVRKHPFMCTATLAIAYDPRLKRFWNYSHSRLNGGPSPALYKKGEIEFFGSTEDSEIFLLPDATSYPTITAGDSIVALAVEKSFLKLLGLENPPPDIDGNLIQWTEIEHEDNPRYVAFLSEQQQLNLRNAWGGKLLNKTKIFMRENMPISKDTPNDHVLETLLTAATAATKDREQRYQLYLLMGTKHRNISTLYTLLMKHEFPTLSFGQFEHDVRTVIESNYQEIPDLPMVIARDAPLAPPGMNAHSPASPGSAASNVNSTFSGRLRLGPVPPPPFV